MKHAVVLILFSWTIFSAAGAQTHFTPVASTGLPYTVIILDMTVNGNPVVPNTEVALFDDTLCVGAAIFTGSYYVTVTAWKGNPSMKLPGFTAGHPIKIKLFSQIQNSWKEFSVSGTFETGDGLFGSGAFSAVRIASTVSKVNDKSGATGIFEMRQFPNPFNGSVQYAVNVSETGDYEFSFSTMDGKILHHDKIFITAGTQAHFGWEAASLGLLSSACYIVSMNGFGRYYSMKSMYIK